MGDSKPVPTEVATVDLPAEEIQSGDADVPCMVCGSNVWVLSTVPTRRSNDLAVCKGCSIVVHQECYGIEAVPQNYSWFCRRCEPHSLLRASKVKCMLCPIRDGALQRTNDSNDYNWAHAICALWIPSVKWQDEDRKFRGVDVSKVGKSEYGANACYICSEKGRPELASTGICIPCSVPNCPRRFHATCAHASGLTDIVEKGDGKVVYSGTCKTHRREKAKASEKAAAEKVERERAANAAKEKAAEKATAQARAAAQRAAREKAAKEKAAAMAKERTERLQRQAERAAAKSKAPSAGSSGSGDPVVCVAPGCSRVFNSLISLRNHERSAHSEMREYLRSQAAAMAASAAAAAQEMQDEPDEASMSEEEQGEAVLVSSSESGASSDEGDSDSEEQRNVGVRRAAREHLRAIKRGAGHGEARQAAKRARAGALGGRDADIAAAAATLFPAAAETDPYLQLQKTQLALLLENGVEKDNVRQSAVLLARMGRLQERTKELAQDSARLLQEKKALAGESKTLLVRAGKVLGTAPAPAAAAAGEAGEAGEVGELLGSLAGDGPLSAAALDDRLLQAAATVLNSFLPPGAAALHPMEVSTLLPLVAAGVKAAADAKDSDPDDRRSALAQILGRSLVQASEK